MVCPRARDHQRAAPRRRRGDPAQSQAFRTALGETRPVGRRSCRPRRPSSRPGNDVMAPGQKSESRPGRPRGRVIFNGRRGRHRRRAGARRLVGREPWAASERPAMARDTRIAQRAEQGADCVCAGQRGLRGVMGRVWRSGREGPGGVAALHVVARDVGAMDGRAGMHVCSRECLRGKVLTRRLPRHASDHTEHDTGEFASIHRPRLTRGVVSVYRAEHESGGGGEPEHPTRSSLLARFCMHPRTSTSRP